MITVLGQEGCSRCNVIKEIFTNNNIHFVYGFLDDLSKKEKDNYIEQAKRKGLLNLPLVIKDGEVIDFEEVL